MTSIKEEPLRRCNLGSIPGNRKESAYWRHKDAGGQGRGTERSGADRKSNDLVPGRERVSMTQRFPTWVIAISGNIPSQRRKNKPGWSRGKKERQFSQMLNISGVPPT